MDADFLILSIEEFHKYLVVIRVNVLNPGGRKFNGKYYCPVNLTQIKEYCQNKTLSDIVHNDYVLNYLSFTQILENLTHPTHLVQFITDTYSSPMEIGYRTISGDRILILSYLISIDPLNDLGTIRSFLTRMGDDIKEEFDNSSVKDTNISKKPSKKENQEYISGFFINYSPPQIFLKFGGRSLADEFRFFRNIPLNETLFEVNDPDYGQFVLLKLNQLFIEKTERLQNPLDFANLFLFYIYTFDKEINSASLLDFFEVNEIPKSEIYEQCNPDVLYNPSVYDPHNRNFYKRYWIFEYSECIRGTDFSIHAPSNIFQNAYGFAKKMYSLDMLHNGFIILFQSLTYYKMGELETSFLLLWVIVEKFIDTKWKDLIQNKIQSKFNGITDPQEQKKLKKNMQSRLYSFKEYSTIDKIDQLLLNDTISEDTYSNLIYLNNVRNKLAHEFVIPTTDDNGDKSPHYKLINLILDIFKQEYQQELKEYFPDESTLNADNLLPLYIVHYL